MSFIWIKLINPSAANNISTYGNTVVAASEENDEEDYVNVETFVNKSKDEDLKKGCRAGMYVKREFTTKNDSKNVCSYERITCAKILTWSPGM